MTMRMTTRIARACLLALALGSAAPSFAVPIMDLRAEDLVPMTSELKQTLNLTDNQQTLFSQVESRSRAILRDRLHRRRRRRPQARHRLRDVARHGARRAGAVGHPGRGRR